ncbi:MAG: hypothetical protein KBT45_00245 [Bacteroidales bacterium]|nr:hypothetical protein [Candidatus Colimorpha pelethequi]
MKNKKSTIIWAGVIIVVVLVVVGIVSDNKGIIYLSQIIATLGLIASVIMLDKQNRNKQ